MRRPAVFAALAFGAGIVSSYQVEFDLLLWIILLTGSAAFSLYCVLYKRGTSGIKIGLFLLFVAAGGVWLNAESAPESLMESCGSDIEIKGVVIESEKKDEMCILAVKTELGKIMVRVYGEHEELDNITGKSVRIYGRAELPQGRRNPGCFDYRLYLKSCGIYVIVQAKTVEVIKGKPIPYLRCTEKIRSGFETRLKEYADDTQCGLIMAVMFGDKTMLDNEIYSDFQRNGTAHVLAVSGLHTGVIYAFFVFLWRAKKGMMFYVLTAVVMFIYMALAEFSPSVVRATCMIFMHSFAGIMRCRYDLLTAAAVTFIIMLLNNPYQIFHTGFQLSFLAIVSLAVIIPFIKRFYQGIFLSTAAIQLGMTPFTAFVFNYISIGSVFANIPVIFIAGIILPVGLCALMSMFFTSDLFGILINVMKICCQSMIVINDFFYASGKTSFDVMSPPVWVIIIYYGVLFLFISEAGQLMCARKNWEMILAGVIVIMMVAVMSIPVMKSDFTGAGIVFVDVGQGDCIHIRSDSGKNYLIDGGGSKTYDTGLKTLKPYLLKNGVNKIDIAFATHLHEDHFGGIRSLSASGMVEKIAVYEANRQIHKQLQDETSAEIVYLRRGHRITLAEDIFIEVISPEVQTQEIYKSMVENDEDENKTSLILKLYYKGSTLLITGDIDAEGEAELLQRYGEELSCDIIKVPHHGSKYSSSEEFIKAAEPHLAIFQVGRNNYGHPAPEIVERYNNSGCTVRRNDEDGAIGVYISDGGELKVVEMIN